MPANSVPFRDTEVTDTEVKLKCPACNRRSDFRYVPTLAAFNSIGIEPCIHCYIKLSEARSQENFDEILASLGARLAKKRRDGDALPSEAGRPSEGYSEDWDK